MPFTTLVELFHEGARMSSEKTAVVLDDGNQKETVTYGSLYHLAQTVSGHLVNAGCQEEVIGVVTTPCVYTAGILVGIMQTPAAYIPLGGQVPTKRLHHLVDTSHIRAFCIQDCLYEDMKFKLRKYEPQLLKSFPQFGMHLVMLSGVPSQKWTHPLAYVMTTSGTTGMPKLVRVPHQCIVPNITHIRSIFQMKKEDVVFAASPLTFDPSIVEMFITLSCGSTLLVVPDKVKLKPQVLQDVLVDRNQVTIIQATPTLMSRFDAPSLQHSLLAADSSLRVLALGGEACPSYQTLQSWRHRDNQAQLYNIYGITEVSCWATIEHITDSSPMSEGSCPLGNALDGTVLEVRNRDGEPIKQGEGELYIGGLDRVCLLDGEDHLERGKLRSTGDIVWLDEKGHLWYRGRCDDQIKRHGKRMNLMELEQVACQLSYINKAVAVQTHETSLYLFTQISEKHTTQDVVKHDIKRHLLDYLPAHYQPDEIVHLTDAFPLTAHGKVDKTKLINMVTDSARKVENPTSSALDLPSVYDAFWSKIKALLLVGEDTGGDLDGGMTFIELGGNSLQMVNVIESLESLTGTDLPWLLQALIDNTLHDASEKLMEHLCNIRSRDTTKTQADENGLSDQQKHVEHPASDSASKETPAVVDDENNQSLSSDVYMMGGEHAEWNSKKCKKTNVSSFWMQRIQCFGCSKCLRCGRWEPHKRRKRTVACGTVLPNLDSRPMSASQVDPKDYPSPYSLDLICETSHCSSKSCCVSAYDRCQTSDCNSKQNCAGQSLVEGHLTHDRSTCVQCSPQHSQKASVISDRCDTVSSHSDTFVPKGTCNAGCLMSVQRASYNNVYGKHRLGSSREQGKSHVNAWTDFTMEKSASCDVQDSENKKVTNTLTERWKFDTGKCVDASPLIVVDKVTGAQVVYMGSHSHSFYAVDLATGGCIWKTLLGDRVESSACLSRCGSYVIVGCYDGCVYVLDRVDGSIWWKFCTESSVKSSPAVDPVNGVVYIGSHDQHCYALDVNCKRKVWKITLGAGSIFASPAVSYQPHHVYVASLGGTLAALTPETGEMRWQVKCGKPLFSSPAVSSEAIFIGCVDGQMLAFSHSGAKLWAFQSGGPIFSSPCIWAAAAKLEQKKSDHLDQALPPSEGQEAYIVFGSHDSHVYCLTETGQLHWKHKSHSPVYATPYVSCDILRDTHISLLDLDISPASDDVYGGRTQVASVTGLPDNHHSQTSFICESHHSKNRHQLARFDCTSSGTDSVKRQGTRDETVPLKKARGSGGCERNNSIDNSFLVKNQQSQSNEIVPSTQLAVMSSCESSKLASHHHVPHCSSHTVIICCTVGVLTIIDLMTGKELTSYHFPGETFSSPLCIDGSIVIACRDNYVYKLDIG